MQWNTNYSIAFLVRILYSLQVHSFLLSTTSRMRSIWTEHFSVVPFIFHSMLSMMLGNYRAVSIKFQNSNIFSKFGWHFLSVNLFQDLLIWMCFVSGWKPFWIIKWCICKTATPIRCMMHQVRSSFGCILINVMKFMMKNARALPFQFLL